MNGTVCTRILTGLGRGSGSLRIGRGQSRRAGPRVERSRRQARVATRAACRCTALGRGPRSPRCRARVLGTPLGTPEYVAAQLDTLLPLASPAPRRPWPSSCLVVAACCNVAAALCLAPRTIRAPDPAAPSDEGFLGCTRSFHSFLPASCWPTSLFAAAPNSASGMVALVCAVPPSMHPPPTSRRGRTPCKPSPCETRSLPPPPHDGSSDHMRLRHR